MHPTIAVQGLGNSIRDLIRSLRPDFNGPIIALILSDKAPVELALNNTDFFITLFKELCFVARHLNVFRSNARTRLSGILET